MFRSIRWTLQLWHAGILLLALGIFGLALYYGVRESEMRRVDTELQAAARVVAARPFPGPMRRFIVTQRIPPPFFMLEGGPRPGRETPAIPWISNLYPGLIAPGPPPWGPQVSGPPDMSLDEPREFTLEPGQDLRDRPYYVIWGSDGSLMRHSAGAPAVPAPESQHEGPPAPPPPEEVRSRGEFREWIVPGPFGTRVLTGRSMQREFHELQKLRWTLLAVGGGIFVIGLIGGSILSRRAIKPIQAISDTASGISASDLSRRINVEETHSELGSLARTLNDTFDRIETAFQRQVRFTADASHELRTPLAVIHSHTELALTRERTAGEYRQTLETCLRASKRMKSLVDSLLVLARADAGKLELRYESFDLRDAAEDGLAMVTPLAQERNIKLSLDTNGQAIRLEADRTRVSQLLTNLLGNAIRYNREGGSVTLAVEAAGDTHALLKVADTGVGIQPDEQQHVFERFFRADKARSREAGGSGLGLAICQSIVEAHQGQIHFTTRPGEGTTFTVRLPRSRTAPPA